jgi:hypothetical protein
MQPKYRAITEALRGTFPGLRWKLEKGTIVGRAPHSLMRCELWHLSTYAPVPWQARVVIAYEGAYARPCISAVFTTPEDAARWAVRTIAEELRNMAHDVEYGA